MCGALRSKPLRRRTSACASHATPCPRGGALFVTAKGRPAKGAFTEQNNETDSLLQIAPIDAETLVLEYEYPEGTRADQLKLPFRLDALFYGFRDFRSAGRAENFAQPGEPF